MNPAQEKAIQTKYEPIAQRFGLSKATVPKPQDCMPDEERVRAIQNELEKSKASTLVLLGDQPIQRFLKRFDPNWSKLSDFKHYGKPQPVRIGGQSLEVIALAHPRQAGKLGRSSPYWYEQHQKWISKRQETLR